MGWQRQASGCRSRACSRRSSRRLTAPRWRWHGAGRTDAGVHALAQVGQLHAPEHARHRHAATRVERAVARRRARADASRTSPPTFHARFSATGKRIGTSSPTVRSSAPSLRRSAWHVTGRLDLATMQQAAAQPVGTHDFSAFQSTGTDVAARRSHRQRVPAIEDVSDGPPPPLPADAVPGGASCWSSRSPANGFLRHMVRAMAGTLVEVGRQASAIPIWPAVLRLGEPGAGRPHCAGARALVGSVQLLINSAFAFLEGS